VSIFNGKLTAAASAPVYTTTANTMATTLYGAGGGGSYITGAGGSASNFTGNIGTVGTAGQYMISNGTTAAWANSNYRVSPLVIHGKDNKEIVRLNDDGTVTWANDIDVDEAAFALGQSLTLNVENSAGLTYAVKQRMRDTVFEEMISMAKEKGGLTADDLTYLHQAAKIMDKLKGKE